MRSTLLQPLTPTDLEVEQARLVSSQLLHGDILLSELPEVALKMLPRVLEEFSQGHSLSVVQIESDITTQEAADYLNVSRPYVVKLLEQGRIPFHFVGNQRRLKLEHILDFKKHQDEESQTALAELQALSQELGLDD
jgi:excisionase family DNA binding protein